MSNKTSQRPKVFVSRLGMTIPNPMVQRSRRRRSNAKSLGNSTSPVDLRVQSPGKSSVPIFSAKTHPELAALLEEALNDSDLEEF